MKEKTKIFGKSSVIRFFLLVSFFLLLSDFIIICIIALSSGFSKDVQMHGFYEFNNSSLAWNSLSGAGIFAIIWTIVSFLISFLIIFLYKKKADFQIGKHNRITVPFWPFWLGILLVFILAWLDKPGLFHITAGLENNKTWFSLLYTTPNTPNININNINTINIHTLTSFNYSVAGYVYIAIAIILVISYLIHFVMFMFRVIFSKNYTVAQKIGRAEGQRFN